MKAKGGTPDKKRFEVLKPKTQQDQGKATAIIAYITIIGFIIALVKNKEEKKEFASFHIRQMFGICCTGLAIGVLGFMPLLGRFLHFFGVLFVILLWVLGMIRAVNGERKPVLGLGTYFQKWFKGIT